MSLFNLRHWIQRIATGRAAGSRYAPRTLRSTLRLEPLDERITPAAITWTGKGDGSSWSDAANWSTDSVPGVSDDVTIGGDTISFTGTDAVNSLTVTGGTLQTSGTLSTAAGLTISSGTITNTGTLAVGGAFTWTSGTLDGAGTTVLNGSSTLSGGFFSMLKDQQVENNGTASVASGASFDLGGGAVWTNEAGSTFDLAGSIGNFFITSSSVFNNAGTLDVAAGAGATATIGVPFDNTGKVVVDSGTFSPTDGGSAGGTFSLSAGTTFNPGKYTLGGASIVGSGQVLLNTVFSPLTVSTNTTIANMDNDSGTLDVVGSLTVQNLTVDGTFSGINDTGTLTVTGNLTWTQGGLTGPGTLVITSAFAMTSGSSSTWTNVVIDNTGTATFSDTSSLNFGSTTVWNNESGGTMVFQGSGSIGSDAKGAVNNAGLIRVAAGSETAKLGVPFNSTGSVDVQSGTLDLTGGGTGSGTFTLDQTGATLAIGAYTLNSASVSGPGAVSLSTFDTLTVAGSSTLPNVDIAGGTVNLDAATTVQSLTISGGTLSNTATLTVSGGFNWSSGSFKGSGTTLLNGSSSLAGGTLTDQQVDNNGTATIAPTASIGLSGAAVWTNEAGSTFDLQGSVGGGNSSLFNNAGTLNVAPGAGATATIGVPFDNTGKVNVQSGTFSPGDGGSAGGTFSLSAGATFNPGKYTLGGASIVGAGQVLLNTVFSPLTVTTASTIANMDNDSGTLDVVGSLTVQNLVVDGTFSGINDTGTLTVSGPLNWTEGGLAGPGTLVLDGASSLAGGFSSMWTNMVINNTGTATFADTDSVDFKGNTVWNNEPGGSLVLQGSGSVSTFFAGTGAAVNNTGLIQVAGGAETAVIGVAVNNTGTIDVESGILSMPAGFTNSGTVTVAPGAAISPDPTTVTFSSSQGVTGTGQSVTFTATVSPAFPGVGTPTGWVSFYDGTTLLGTPGLNAAGTQATFTTSALAIGTHTITAVYNGDSHYQGSTSAASSQGVLSPGVAVYGTALYLVGANTNDSVSVKAVGKSATGSTGLSVTATLNGVKYSKSYAEPFTAVYVYGAGGNDTVSLASSLTVSAYVTEADGKDSVTTAGGVDVINLGGGSDKVTTGNGNKTITLGGGSDTVTAGTGADAVTLGNGGKDTVTLGNGNNTVTVGNGSSDVVKAGNGNNVIVMGNGSADKITAGNGDNLIAAGTGQHSVTAGKGSNMLIDGSVAVTQPGMTLEQVLAAWIAGGNTPTNVTNIRSELQVTYNSSHVNTLSAGSGMDWFWFAETQDHTNMKKTDLHN